MLLLGHLDFTTPTHSAGEPRTVTVRVGDGRETRDCPRGPDAIHLLVYNDPAVPVPSYRQGWTLVAWHDRAPRWWTVSLAAHGAAAIAGPRVAKAVAVRVLADQGLTVEDWSDGHHGELAAAYRAILHTEVSATVVPGAGSGNDERLVVAPATAPRVRIRRLGRWRGHQLEGLPPALARVLITRGEDLESRHRQ